MHLTLPLSQTVTHSHTPFPSSVTYFMDGPFEMHCNYMTVLKGNRRDNTYWDRCMGSVCGAYKTYIPCKILCEAWGSASLACRFHWGVHSQLEDDGPIRIRI